MKEYFWRTKKKIGREFDGLQETVAKSPTGESIKGISTLKYCYTYSGFTLKLRFLRYIVPESYEVQQELFVQVEDNGDA